MLSTENYLLHKPEGDEKVDINLINENMDTIDRNLKGVSDTLNRALLKNDEESQSYILDLVGNSTGEAQLQTVISLKL